MNPIALRHNRHVYAYACGRCLVVPTIGSYLGYPLDADRHAKRVSAKANEYRRAAESCCRCHDCKTELEPGTTSGRCPPCETAEKTRVDGVVSELRAQDTRRAAYNQEAMASVGADEFAATRLAAEMSEISEEYYCAGWLSDLEYTLWSFAIDTSGDPCHFGMGEVKPAEIQLLRDLCAQARGWWRWDDALGGEVFVPMAEWERIYAARQ